MKIYYLFILIFVGLGRNVFGQTDSTLIEQRTMYKYGYQNKLYTKKQLGEIIYLNPTAYDSYKRYRSLGTVSGISASVSVFSFAVIGSGVGYSCYGDGDLCPAFIALGLFGGIATITSAVTFLSSRVRFYKSVRLFNEGIQASQKTGRLPMELNLTYTGNGVGLVLSF